MANPGAPGSKNQCVETLRGYGVVNSAFGGERPARAGVDYAYVPRLAAQWRQCHADNRNPNDCPP